MQLLYKDRVSIAANTTSTDLLNQKRVKTIPTDYPVYAVRFYSGSDQRLQVDAASITLNLQEALFVGSDNLIEQSPVRILVPGYYTTTSPVATMALTNPVFDGFPGLQHETISFFAAAGAQIQLNVVNVSSTATGYLYAVELLPADTGEYDLSEVIGQAA